MSNLKQLEQEALSLPVRDRERLVLSMWDSLESVRDIDADGIAVATARDAQVESGAVAAISHAEFRHHTDRRHSARYPEHGMERQ